MSIRLTNRRRGAATTSETWKIGPYLANKGIFHKEEMTMKRSDMLWIEANMNKWNGRHFLDKENKRRMMDYKGILFVWDADLEVWNFCEEA